MKYTLIFSATVVWRRRMKGWGEGWRSQGLDFPLNKGFVSQLREGISDNLNHKKSAQNVFTIRLRTTTNFPNCLSNYNLMVIIIIMMMHLGIMCMGMWWWDIFHILSLRFWPLQPSARNLAKCLPNTASSHCSNKELKQEICWKNIWLDLYT